MTGEKLSVENLADITKDDYEFNNLLRLSAQRVMELVRSYRNNTEELSKFLYELEGSEIENFVNGYNTQPYQAVNNLIQNHFNVR